VIGVSEATKGALRGSVVAVAGKGEHGENISDEEDVFISKTGYPNRDFLLPLARGARLARDFSRAKMLAATEARPS